MDARKIAVKTLTIGAGSVDDNGRYSQRMRTCPGLNRQKSLRHMGSGSQTASSHTSLVGAGCDLDSADVGARILERVRRGDEDIGDESTRTLEALGVFGAPSTEASKRR